MHNLLEALNRPIHAFRSKNGKLSWSLVAVVIAVTAIIDPIVNYFSNKGNFYVSIDVGKILLLMITGVGTYLIVCMMFWLIGKILGSESKPLDYINTWGMTYFPTILCSVIVMLTETYFYVFWNSLLWAIIFNIVFGGILLWKTILYVMFLNETVGLRGWKLAAGFLLCGIVILILAFADANIGLKTPVL